MTLAQESIMAYIQKNFVPGSVRCVPEGDDCVRVIDRTGESMRLTMNLFGDIMDADTNFKYAISNLPHDIEKIGSRLPSDWTELDHR